MVQTWYNHGKYGTYGTRGFDSCYHVSTMIVLYLREKRLNLAKIVNSVGSELHASSFLVCVYFAEKNALSKF